MTRPNFFYYLAGNPISTLAGIAASGFLLFQWWMGRTGSLAPVIAVFLLGTVMNASQKISDYGDWKRSWDAIGGVSPSARWAWLRMPVAVALWVGGAVGVSKLDPHQPMTHYAVLGFTLGSMLIVGMLLYRLWRRWAARHPRQRKTAAVTISLRVPRKSPGPRQFNKGVPAYCARLS